MIRRTENLVLTLVLGGMVLLPVIEILLRGIFRVGIVNAAAIVQHLVLIVGMLGAMAATRDNRLLAFSGLENVLPETGARWARLFSGTIALVVTLHLMVASYDFVLSERNGNINLAYGIPVWVAQAIMPVGFACIALRLLWKGASSMGGRLGLLTVGISGAAASLMEGSGSLTTTLELVLILGAAVLGAPMFIVLGGAALALFGGDGLPTAAVPLSHYQLTTNPSLPAIPLFTLAGYFLAEGGAPKRLIRVFRAFFGPIKGGTALVSVLLTAFFTSFTGASGVTILALGGLLMPLLTGVQYSSRSALGLVTSAPALGTLLPPALPLILYAIIARQPIETLFLAGILPAALMTLLLVAWGIATGPRNVVREAFSPHEMADALWGAKWEIALPILAFFSLMTGWVTPVETAAITAAYAFIVECCIHKDLRLTSDVPRIMSECGVLIGGIILILGMALGFTNYVTDAQLPERATEWVSATISARWVFLLALNLLLLAVGMLMDIFSAIIVVTPLIVPMGAAFGIDPIHLGIIFLANMELGFLTPPVGMNLFFASYRFCLPLSEVIRAILPALLVMAIGVAMITYIPALSTWLPGQFSHHTTY